MSHSFKGYAMRSKLCGLAILAVFGLLARAGFAADEKKADEKNTPEKMIKQGQLTGKIVAVDETKKSLKIQLTYSLPKFNQGEYNGLLQAQRDYQNALARRDANAARNAANAVAQHQAKLYTYEQKTKDIDLQTIDEVVVRAAAPPPAFDDKGQLKKYTKKELDELKGPDKKLPGYTADFGSLRNGQVVMVTLVKKKDDKKEPMVKPKTKEELEEAMLANLPQVSMVIIVTEPAN
jgi:hypothetical protein